MKITSRKNLHRFMLLLVCGGLIVLLYVLATAWLEDKIQNKLAFINARSSSLYVNLLSRSVRVEDFKLFLTDSTPYSLQLKTLSIRQIDLYRLWKHDEIVIHKIEADSGRIIIDQSIKKDSTRSRHTNLKTITIQNLSVTRITGELRYDTLLKACAQIDFYASGFSMKTDSIGQPAYTLEAFDGNMMQIRMNPYTGMYGTSIQNFQFNSATQKVVIDSVLLIPHYSKFEFARKKGEQVPRINLSVPKIEITGINLYNLADSMFTASKIEIISFDLHSFKDKRVPFLRNYNIPLPMESFLKLPVQVSVDSLVIQNSRVTIEEIAEGGTESGAVVIDHINAAAAQLNNRYQEGMPKQTVLHATGFIMGTGEINADFSLPLDGTGVYTTRGNISNLPLDKLNPVLENLVRFRIESGKLNNMKLNFQYTDLQSTGTVEIDYENLKITGLKKKKDDTSDIKTLFINALIKNDKTRDLSKLKRTGTIDIERDRRRYIFNVWWKSILDGLKSSILGIEKNKKSNGKKK